MHISASSKRRGGWGMVSLCVWERERSGGVVGAVLWSTQPHYSVDRTAHPLHCSSDQPKLTGLIRSPQNRTELLYGLRRSCRWDLQNDQSRVQLFYFFFFFLFKFPSLSSMMIWFLLGTSFVISGPEWYKDDTNMRERCLNEMFSAVWSSPRQSSLEMTCDSEGYIGSNGQRAWMIWWIICRNVNCFRLCCSMPPHCAWWWSVQD